MNGIYHVVGAVFFYQLGVERFVGVRVTYFQSRRYTYAPRVLFFEHAHMSKIGGEVARLKRGVEVQQIRVFGESNVLEFKLDCSQNEIFGVSLSVG